MFKLGKAECQSVTITSNALAFLTIYKYGKIMTTVLTRKDLAKVIYLAIYQKIPKIYA